jgi:exodeoxyribonuclease-3
MRLSMSSDVKLLSWNVNGVRAVEKKGFGEWLQRESPDFLCIQETKASPEQLSADLLRPVGYHTAWASAERKGYSGVGIYAKRKPLDVSTKMGRPEFDREGRVLKAVYDDFTLINLYFPNGKRDKERLRFKMDFYRCFLEWVEGLRRMNPRIIFCGDVNTAHHEIDLARPKENEKVSGFLPEERAWLDEVVSLGYVDTFRHKYPDKIAYSWWDLKSRARERNIGWRIDYIFVTAELLDSVKDACIRGDVEGSDHCPVGITLSMG